MMATPLAFAVARSIATPRDHSPNSFSANSVRWDAPLPRAMTPSTVSVQRKRAHGRRSGDIHVVVAEIDAHRGAYPAGGMKGVYL